MVSWLFGLVLIAFALFVSAETVSRKVFNFSFQGADELGGYALAIGGALSFTIALLERGHIRIDLLHDKLGTRAQAVFFPGARRAGRKPSASVLVCSPINQLS